MKTKLLCSRRRATGFIDAPRRWWKSLVRDTQQLVWRSCRHEPCLMTWHVLGRLKGLMCFSRRRRHDQRSERRSRVQTYDGQCETSVRVGRMGTARIRSVWLQNTTSNRQVPSQSDQESYARKISLITMSAHQRKHMSETLSAEEHTTLMAKRGELNWLATPSMSQLPAPLSLVDTSKTATGQSLKDANRLVRQAHCEASDKLHYPVISDLGCFVC